MTNVGVNERLWRGNRAPDGPFYVKTAENRAASVAAHFSLGDQDSGAAKPGHYSDVVIDTGLKAAVEAGMAKGRPHPIRSRP
jgi:hypothetical protein